MMNLLAKMDLQNIKIKILAKANKGIEFICPPAKAGGNSLNRNAALAHSIIDKSTCNSLKRNVAFPHSINNKLRGISLNRNAALAYS
jgi:hypothetical protein